MATATTVQVGKLDGPTSEDAWKGRREPLRTSKSKSKSRTITTTTLPPLQRNQPSHTPLLILPSPPPLFILRRLVETSPPHATTVQSGRPPAPVRPRTGWWGLGCCVALEGGFIDDPASPRSSHRSSYYQVVLSSPWGDLVPCIVTVW
jgi:hypothetical protein